jgi:dephospho-CoA kinase
MLCIGLTGGVATGKSVVGQELSRLGCRVLRADDLGHAVLLRGGEAYEPVIQVFGPEILSTDGQIDRQHLAGIVFHDETKLKLLNSLVHPAVFSREEAWMQQVEDADPCALAVVEAAILIETGSFRRFHKLVLAVCDEEQQIERAMARDGATREDVLARIRRQMPLMDKKRFADYVIDTSRTMDDTIAQVARLYESLRSVNACGNER